MFELTYININKALACIYTLFSINFPAYILNEQKINSR